VGINPDDHLCHDSLLSLEPTTDGEVGSATSSWAIP
jgi:hypothetical protein